MKVEAFGDRAVAVEWPEGNGVGGYSEEASLRALALAERLRGSFREVVPGYRSVVAEFDPARTDMASALALVEREAAKSDAELAPGREVVIPVRYGGRHGPDMGRIRASSGLSESEVIRLHSERPYRVCTMGFIPGFAFLSATDEALHHPRHATPRADVSAGSVGIAGWQTGIYGLSSPGGWQIIGRTESVVFDPDRAEPFLLRAGDTVRFKPV